MPVKELEEAWRWVGPGKEQEVLICVYGKARVREGGTPDI
jgi:hypothetical protein